MRSDAKRNYDHLLAVALTIVGEKGADASLRDIARTAGVGLGTLYRHFPTREALLEALLRTGFDGLAEKAMALERSTSPREALVLWLADLVGHARTYRGVTTAMMSAIEEPDSALHASCIRMQEAGSRLLARVQADGQARPEMDGTDLFAFVGALAWLGEQPLLASRIEHLFNLVVNGMILNVKTPSI